MKKNRKKTYEDYISKIRPLKWSDLFWFSGVSQPRAPGVKKEKKISDAAAYVIISVGGGWQAGRSTKTLEGSFSAVSTPDFGVQIL